MTAREKQKNYRVRSALGLAVLKVDVELIPLIESLADPGRLSLGACLERRAVEHAAAEILYEWAQKWREIADSLRLLTQR